MKIPCPKCNQIDIWKRSDRKHKRFLHYFVFCTNCGYESQATDNGIYNTNPTKNRANGERSIYNVSAKLTKSEFERVKQSRLTVHELIVLGLENL